MDLIYLKDIAIRAAQDAGNLIRSYIDVKVKVEEKEAGSTSASQVVTKVDRESEQVIMSHLLPTRREFDLALLSEETEDDGSRLEKDFFWCIDPMDGTLPFINSTPGFSVSIALVAKDGTPYIGVVYDPTTGNLYHAVKGHGAFKNRDPLNISRDNKYLAYITDKKLQETPGAGNIMSILREVVSEQGLTGYEERSGAGAVMNAIYVLEHGPACFLKLPKNEKGGGSIWDYAATTCIYNELGLPATTFNGGILNLNKKSDTFMNQEGVFFKNFSK